MLENTSVANRQAGFELHSAKQIANAIGTISPSNVRRPLGAKDCTRRQQQTNCDATHPFEKAALGIVDCGVAPPNVIVNKYRNLSLEPAAQKGTTKQVAKVPRRAQYGATTPTYRCRVCSSKVLNGRFQANLQR